MHLDHGFVIYVFWINLCCRHSDLSVFLCFFTLLGHCKCYPKLWFLKPEVWFLGAGFTVHSLWELQERVTLYLMQH